MLAVVAVALLVSAVPEGDGEKGDIRLSWRDNMLTVHSPRLPGGKLEIWYLEAFCRSGSTDRDWAETVIPHTTELVEASEDGASLHLRSTVEPGVNVEHRITAVPDGVAFDMVLTNTTEQAVDVDWAQPCIRVDAFTGLSQEDYIRKCFIFTEEGLTTLDRTRRTEEARYRGGQVYVPEGIDLDDVNPRPISPETPVNGLIGCFSADDSLLLAMAWDNVQELFQGVIVCIHSDPRIGGLEAGETRRLKGRLYLMNSDPEALLKRYRGDFGLESK